MKEEKLLMLNQILKITFCKYPWQYGVKFE